MMSTLFLKCTKIWQRENGKFVDFSDPTQVWRRPSKKYLRISTNDLYRHKLDSLTYIFAADNVGLCLLLFTQLSLKVEPSESKTERLVRLLHDIATQGHSRSFILQLITGRQRVSFCWPYIWSFRKLQSSTTPLSFEAPPRRTPANVRMHLMFPETIVIAIHFCRWHRPYSNMCSGLQHRKTHLFCTRVRISRSRSSKVTRGR